MIWICLHISPRIIVDHSSRSLAGKASRSAETIDGGSLRWNVSLRSLSSFLRVVFSPFTPSILFDNLSSFACSMMILSSWLLLASFNSSTSPFTSSNSPSTDLNFFSKVFFSVSSLSIFSFKPLISLSFKSTVSVRSSFFSVSCWMASLSFDISSSFSCISFLRKAISPLWLTITFGSIALALPIAVNTFSCNCPALGDISSRIPSNCLNEDIAIQSWQIFRRRWNKNVKGNC